MRPGLGGGGGGGHALLIIIIKCAVTLQEAPLDLYLGVTSVPCMHWRSV